MAEQLRVFVSHSHKDNAFCHQIVQALREAGADVWYDEHNMNSGRLGPTIERELRKRPIFIVILTPAALRSQWVEDETRWAYGLLRKDPKRLLQPITGAPIREDDIWLFLRDFKRIEAPGCRPYSVKEAANRLVRALGLTPAGEAPAPVAGQPAESVLDLLRRGDALEVLGRDAEALPLFERATQLDPGSFWAWFALGNMLDKLGRWHEALTACDRALALDDKQGLIWDNRGRALDALGRYEEALAAYDRALTLDPNDISALHGKMLILRVLGRDA